MKILLSADWHIGVRGDSLVYHEIFDNFIDEFLIPTLKEKSITKLAILADIFDNRNAINVKTINIAEGAFHRIFTEIPELEINLLVGNHDLYFRNTREITSLVIFNNKFTNLKVIKHPLFESIDNRNILYCPWLIGKDELSNLLKNKPDVVLGHFEVNEFEMVKGYLETHGIDPQIFVDNTLKVFSGHFHLRRNKYNIQYVGSPYQLNWGDYDDNKGVYVFDTKTLNAEFIENKISPRYLKVFVSQLKNKTVSFDDLTGNFIKVVVDDDKITKSTLDKIVEVINKKQPRSFEMEDLDKSTDLKVDVSSDVKVPIEYLRDYIQKLTLDDKIDKQHLIKRFDLIYNRIGG